MLRGLVRFAGRGAFEGVNERVCVSSQQFRGAERWYAKSSRRPVGRKETGLAVQSRWTQVWDPNNTGASYWWNKATNQTTVVGAPRPTGEVAHQQAPVGNQLTSPYDNAGRPSMGLQIGQMMVFGFGGALGVTFISVVIAAISGGAKMEDGSRKEKRHQLAGEGEGAAAKVAA
jgi:hypothetical protein|tara:strand:- start:330 stop:848 length:519 start_codon:yes stop_codon:yes gene_type:complete|mmetsp:Transcript_4471/g.14916  ORF Transcript_4471/g.14916 Transcript_4471/m.14916 type:complete len:173 (-) Transcript_4471:49-567(-)